MKTAITLTRETGFTQEMAREPISEDPGPEIPAEELVGLELREYLPHVTGAQYLTGHALADRTVYGARVTLRYGCWLVWSESETRWLVYFGGGRNTARVLAQGSEPELRDVLTQAGKDAELRRFAAHCRKTFGAP